MDLNVPVEGGHVWADDRAGDEPAIVLLHSGWSDSSSWLPVMQRLPAHYRVIRYDIRGYARSPAATAPFSPVGDLTAVLDHLGADRVVIVGHSLGGATAISFALAYPARVRALLLLAPGVQDYPWPRDDPYAREFTELYAAGDRDGLIEFGMRYLAPADALGAPGAPSAREQIRGAVGTFFGGPDLERPDPPAFSRLGEIRVPAVVVVGDREYPMIARCAAQVADRIPGCRRIPAPGADHMLPLRVPDMIADLAATLVG